MLVSKYRNEIKLYRSKQKVSILWQKKCNAELKLQDLATDKAIKLILCFLLNKHLKTQISIVTDKL